MATPCTQDDTLKRMEKKIDTLHSKVDKMIVVNAGLVTKVKTLWNVFLCAILGGAAYIFNIVAK